MADRVITKRCPQCPRAYDGKLCEHGLCPWCHRFSCPRPSPPLGVEPDLLGGEFEGLRIGKTFEYQGETNG